MTLTTRRPGATTAPVRDRAVAMLTSLALVLAAFVVGAVTAAPASATTVESQFTSRLNQARAARGVHRLVTRDSLVSVARSWAATMAERSRLYHNPNLTSQVSNYRWVGENVGYGPEAGVIHVAFMNSPAHRANILDRDYTEVGVGAVVRNGRVWVAQVFRRPASAVASRTVSTTATPRSAPPASFSHTLRYGAQGRDVKRVQGRLGLRQTGFYGTATKAAVSRFQKRQGWSGLGNTGPKTWKRLF